MTGAEVAVPLDEGEVGPAAAFLDCAESRAGHHQSLGEGMAEGMERESSSGESGILTGLRKGLVE